MEVDKYKNDGSLIVATYRGLFTTNGNTTTNLLPYNHAVSSFIQVNASFLVLVDRTFYCIKTLERKSGQVKVLTGKCDRHPPYNKDFLYPWGIQLDVRNPGNFLVTDEYLNKINSVNILTGEFKTVTRSLWYFNKPNNLAWHGQELLISNTYNYITKLSWSKTGYLKASRLAGSKNENGDKVGSLQESRFTDIKDIKKIADGYFLIAENYQLKLLDMNKKTVGPVCFHGEKKCEASSSFREQSWSILNVGQEIYVGLSDKIIKLSGKKNTYLS